MSMYEEGIELNENGWGIVPTFDEINWIIKNTKNASIDLEETILNTVRSGWMDENYFVSTIDGSYIFDVMQLEDVEYDFLSDEYFEFINNKLDEGIYIALGYACDECGSESDIEGEQGTSVSTWKDDVEFSLPEDMILGDMETDYGIQVFKKEDEYEIIFSFNDSIRYGHAMGYREISSIENELEEPLHRALIKLMYDAIVLKEWFSWIKGK